MNARSFDDILLIDGVVLGTTSEHEAAREAAAKKSNKDISIGTPLFPFVEFVLPGDAFNFWGLRNGTVSVALRAKYDRAVKVLGDAGFDIVAKVLAGGFPESFCVVMLLAFFVYRIVVLLAKFSYSCCQQLPPIYRQHLLDCPRHNEIFISLTVLSQVIASTVAGDVAV